MERIVDPPAIVKAATSEKTHAALIERIRSIEDSIVRDEKLNLERAFEQGKLLIELKDQCVNHDWLATLTKTGIPERRAQERIRLAKCLKSDARRISEFSSIREAIEAFGPEPQTPAQTTYRAPAGSPGSLLFCNYCRKHSPRSKCKDCDAKRAEAKGVTPSREPGDDTDSEAAAAAKAKEEAKKNGQAAWTWNSFATPWGQAMRQITEMSKALYGDKPPAQLKEARQHVNKAYDLIKAAKDAATQPEATDA